MGHEHLIPVGTLRLERREIAGPNGLMRDSKDAQVELRIDQPSGLVGSHIHAQLLEQPED
jgi:hypothetical protein